MARSFSGAVFRRTVVPRSTSAFTIMELLVVIGIIALLGGLSVGGFHAARRNYGLQASAAEIKTVLRAARNTSIVTASPSFVVIDPTKKTVRAHRYDTLGEWSFEGDGGEDSLFGNSDETVHLAASNPEGRVGSCLLFAGSGGYVDCGAKSKFDVRDSLIIEAWVQHSFERTVPPPASWYKKKKVRLTGSRKEKLIPAMAIVEKRGSYYLGLTKKGAVEVGIGDYRARTAEYSVNPQRWAYVSLRYDGKRLEVFIDGVRRETRRLDPGRLSQMRLAKELPTSAPVTTSHLTISSADSEMSFHGKIDEVRLRGQVEPLEYQYAEHEYIVGWKKIVHFNRRGHLDPAYHEEPIRLALLDLVDEPSEGRTKVLVDYSLTFEEWRGKQGGSGRGRETGSQESAEELEKRIETRLLANPEVKRMEIIIDRLGVVK